jgi:hypothetical protein
MSSTRTQGFHWMSLTGLMRSGVDHANKSAMDSCIASAYGMDEKDKVDLIELLHE